MPGAWRLPAVVSRYAVSLGVRVVRVVRARAPTSKVGEDELVALFGARVEGVRWTSRGLDGEPLAACREPWSIVMKKLKTLVLGLSVALGSITFGMLSVGVADATETAATQAPEVVLGNEVGSSTLLEPWTAPTAAELIAPYTLNNSDPAPVVRCNGITDDKKRTCCASSCGKCGGVGCSQRPGGAKNCCVGTIHDSRIYCVMTSGAAPCIL